MRKHSEYIRVCLPCGVEIEIMTKYQLPDFVRIHLAGVKVCDVGREELKTMGSPYRVFGRKPKDAMKAQFDLQFE